MLISVSDCCDCDLTTSYTHLNILHRYLQRIPLYFIPIHIYIYGWQQYKMSRKKKRKITDKEMIWNRMVKRTREYEEERSSKKNLLPLDNNKHLSFETLFFCTLPLSLSRPFWHHLYVQFQIIAMNIHTYTEKNLRFASASFWYVCLCSCSLFHTNVFFSFFLWGLVCLWHNTHSWSNSHTVRTH